jgi:hypothetical protein
LDESICPHDAEIEAFFNKFLGQMGRQVVLLR